MISSNPSMIVLEMILLGFLIVCSIIATVQKNLLSCVLIFMSYSLIMSVIWVLLESPDLAITEAAVGAGVTTILFFITLKKIGQMKIKHEEDLGIRNQRPKKGDRDA